MKTDNTKQLAAKWMALYESAESDQWELASIAYLAVEIEGGKPSDFAQLVGKTVRTVRKYRKAWELRQTIDIADVDAFTFSDAYALSDMSDQKAAAVMLVAAGRGEAVATAKDRTVDIAVMRNYLNENPDVVQEALKDEGTRAAVNQAAFKAATEQLTEKHRGDEAAKRDRVKERKDTIQTANKRLEIDKAMVSLMHLERQLITGLARIVTDLESNYSTQLFTADKEAAALELMDQMAEAISTQRAKVLGLRTAEAVTY